MVPCQLWFQHLVHLGLQRGISSNYWKKNNKHQTAQMSESAPHSDNINRRFEYQTTAGSDFPPYPVNRVHDNGSSGSDESNGKIFFTKSMSK